MNTADYSFPKENEPDPTMEAPAVLALYNALENLGVQIWVDGGWGVDALLENETRAHKVLDIAIQEKDLPKFRQLLESSDYKEIKLEIARGVALHSTEIYYEEEVEKALRQIDITAELKAV